MRITLATSQGPQLPQNVMMNGEICVNKAALRRPIIRGINFGPLQLIPNLFFWSGITWECITALCALTECYV